MLSKLYEIRPDRSGREESGTSQATQLLRLLALSLMCLCVPFWAFDASSDDGLDEAVINSTSAWAVHANRNAGTDNGGVVTVKSAGTGPAASPGKIFLTGLALQASAAAHGQGGTVDVEGVFDVDLRAIGSNPDGSIQAKGGNGAPSDHGGHIIILSQADIRAGAASNLNVTGHPNTAADDGTVVLQVCAGHAIDFPPIGGPGTITPLDAIVTRTVGPCPAAVSFESYVRLPFCTCENLCPTD